MAKSLQATLSQIDAWHRKKIQGGGDAGKADLTASALALQAVLAHSDIESDALWRLHHGLNALRSRSKTPVMFVPSRKSGAGVDSHIVQYLKGAIAELARIKQDQLARENKNPAAKAQEWVANNSGSLVQALGEITAATVQGWMATYRFALGRRGEVRDKGRTAGKRGMWAVGCVDVVKARDQGMTCDQILQALKTRAAQVPNVGN